MRHLCQAGQDSVQGHSWGQPGKNCWQTLLKKCLRHIEVTLSCKFDPYLVELRLLQVVPLELGVQVGESLHTKVIEVGQLLHLI